MVRQVAGEHLAEVDALQSLFLVYLFNTLTFLPVSIVDNNSFRTFLADIDTNISAPCWQTVTQSTEYIYCCNDRLQCILDIVLQM